MPNRTLPFDWNDIPIVLALAQEGSMRAASRRLGVDTSTISRRLAAAEQRLQTRLFIRGAGGYEPTEAGRVFLRAAESVEDQVRALLSDTRSESAQVHGTVRITSVDVLLDDWLVPRLPSLLGAHPRLQVRLLADNRALSFTRREADLALRLARPREDAALLMRRVGRVGMAVYGAPMYRRFERERWRELSWLAYGEELADVPEMQWLRKQIPDCEPRLRTSSVTGLLKACEAGLGLALLPCHVVRTAAVVCLSPAPELYRDLWLLRHRAAIDIPRYRAVADWLVARLKADAALFSGAETTPR